MNTRTDAVGSWIALDEYRKIVSERDTFRERLDYIAAMGDVWALPSHWNSWKMGRLPEFADCRRINLSDIVNGDWE